MGCPHSKSAVVEQTKPDAAQAPAAVVSDQEPSAEMNVLSFLLSPAVVVQRAMSKEQSSDATPISFLREGAHHLRNVFAAPISFILGSSLPHFSKTQQEIDFLREHLKKNYLFESLPEGNFAKLINAFEKVEITVQDQNAITDGNGVSRVDLIVQGDIVNKDTAFFYVLYRGKCSFSVDGKIVGWAKPGDSFGELALLYDCPRSATVTAVLEEATPASSIATTAATVTPSASAVQQQPHHQIPKSDSVVLFRVHQRNFRLILQQADQSADTAKMRLLEGVPFLQNVSPQQKAKLASVMTPRTFQEGEVLVHKGQPVFSFFLIERGEVKVANISVHDDEQGSHHGYQDVSLKEGQYFGERAITTGEGSVADVIAQSSGVAFTVDKETFQEVLGSLQDIVLRSIDQMKLKAIPVLAATTQSDARVLGFLASQIVDLNFKAGTKLCEEGQPLPHAAALYLVRQGKIEIRSSTETEPELIGVDGYFGDDQLLADTQDRKVYISPYTATVIDNCTCGVLKLVDCRPVLNTHRMGQRDNISDFDSLVAKGRADGTITMSDLKVHRMLGAGTFGQVFLVSRGASDGTRLAYALKVQSKYELCQSGQAKGVVREKNIMALFHNPFVPHLVASFQDETCVYMLMNFVQGGELYNVMHSQFSDVLTESDAKFYIACIAEALRYLHCSHSLVFRDLKPENVMIDNQGYAVLIDFGFCKKITGLKTYTMCGTPLYLAPEIILNVGHSWSVDHWSLGIMLFEMLVGYTPFYKRNMTKSELFRAIVKDKVHPPSNASPVALNLLGGLLKRNPAKRLGSLAGGEADILDHHWFADVDMDLLFLKEIKAPFVPKIKDPFDDSNFKDWNHREDKRHKKYPKLTREEADIFKGF